MCGIELNNTHCKKGQVVRVSEGGTEANLPRIFYGLCSFNDETVD